MESGKGRGGEECREGELVVVVERGKHREGALVVVEMGICRAS